MSKRMQALKDIVASKNYKHHIERHTPIDAYCVFTHKTNPDEKRIVFNMDDINEFTEKTGIKL